MEVVQHALQAEQREMRAEMRALHGGAAATPPPEVATSSLESSTAASKYTPDVKPRGVPLRQVSAWALEPIPQATAGTDAIQNS